MTYLQCLVILSAWTCLSVSVGIRVPSAWDELPINPNHRFSNVNGQQGYNGGGSERRIFLENEQANADLGSLYSTLQSSALNNFFGRPQQMLVVSHDGVLVLPQNNQENAAISSESNQYSTELPPLRHPRYPHTPQLQNHNIPHERTLNHLSNVPVAIGTNQYQKSQTLPLGSIEKYPTLRSNVLRIVPSSSGNGDWNNYNHMVQPVLQQPALKQFTQKYKPLVHKEYARTPTISYGNQVEVPVKSLKNHVTGDGTFIVSASTLSPIESDQNQDRTSAEFATKKEPIFFVTEGYRNVLVQGPNKKKKYQKPQYQNQEASKKVLSTKKFEKEDTDDEDNEEGEKPSRRRKVTKIYKIHNEGRENNVGGSSRNLVQTRYEKPRQYFQRPTSEDDKRSGVKNPLVNNYRDDKLHEPSDDHDGEREDDDNERIKDEENEEELDVEEENETEDAEEIINEDTPKLENNTDKEGSNENKESDDTEESDNEDTENVEEEEEEEAQQEVPHSEHADPKPVPTQPIYPGEGVWAKPGVKHRPHISQHRFIKPQELEQKPDGYDVFEDLEKYFENQKDQFGRTFGQKTNQPGQPVPNIQIKPPNSVNPTVIYDPFNEPSNRQDSLQIPSSGTISNHQGINNGHIEDTNPVQNAERPESNDGNDAENDDYQDESDKKEDFVPMQIYTQVRKSDNEKHEAYDPAEHGRLREVIKDSKIQTIYTEEGFEDAAYDHAGHEKKAEQDQGHEEFEKEKLKKEIPKENKESDSYAGQSNKVFISDDSIEDSLPADSIYPSLPKENIVENIETSNISTKKPQTSNKKDFITTQEVKTTQVKDKKNGDVQLEIQSEVKVIVQPNNSTKAHKYVKIYPKVLKEFSKKVPEDTDDDDDVETEIETSPSLTTTERSENNTNKTLKTEKVDNGSDEIESDILEQVHTNVENGILTNSKTVIDSSSTTESSLAAKISIKAFANEFDKAVTSEKPKVTVKVLDNEEALAKISDQFGKIGSQIRRKRSTDSDKDLEIDIGFIDKINHTFAKKEPETIDVEKYPYYALPDLNENSPLRYAENIDNIPVKKAGELSFYNMADKYECPDVPQNIDPVPEDVENAEESESDEYDNEDDDDKESEDDEGVEKNDEEEDDEDESVVDQKRPPTPRIKLGDKIDCLKIRYFGENPLDSPFFKEETVGPVKSIFKELEQKSAQTQNRKTVYDPQKTSQVIESVNKVNEIFNQKDKKDERKYKSEVKDKVYNALQETAQRDNLNTETDTATSIESEYDNAESINSNVRVIKPVESKKSFESQHTKPTPLPLVTLITTPKYTLQLKPKNIYDQITLLDHLPEEEDITEIIETSTDSIELTTEKATTRVREEDTKETAKEVAQKRIDQDDGRRESSRREPKILKEERFRKNEYDQDSPEADALRRRRLRPRKPLYQIFDVNKFLTTTPYSIINPAHNTVLPKHKVISEVFYKDEIKPNEQLNVFADILNNIKNSSNIEILPLQSASDFAEPNSVTISNLEETNIISKVQTSPNIRVKKYQRDSSNTKNFIERNPQQTRVTTEKYYNARYPESYEEHHRTPSSTNKNIVNLIFNNPDNLGYLDETTQDTVKKIYSDDDSESYRIYSDNKVVPTNNKILRRRRKPTKETTTSTTSRITTNINVPVPNQSTPSNHKPYIIDVFDDNKEVVGLVPPNKGVLYKTIVEDSDGTGTNEVPQKIYEYKTIPPNYVTEPLTGVAAVTELIIEDTPLVRSMNKYYFLGLKPPLNQRARSYAEFIGNNNVVNSNNNIRRRVENVGYGHSRLKREAARATYSEVSRNRGSQNEGIRKESTTSYDDVDDYVPHRPKNYFYDEKTGKIVYNNKPKVEKESEEEEEEYEEIPDTAGIYLETAEDATHPTPKKATTKPLLATATPPPAGQGLLDFVAKLKNNPSYKVLPDRTTPDPSNKTSTQETVTVDPKSTNPPEFLNILSKVKSDSSYKFIEDPKESKGKSKTTSTTAEPEYEEEEEEEEGSSPHRRYVRQIDLQIFNIGDYLPKIQSPISSPIPNTPTNFFKKQIVERIFPKLRYMTPFDIAKEKIRERFQNNSVYQFIQKNIQNSPGDQGQELSNIQIFDIGEYLPKVNTVSPKTSIDYSKYKTIERPHTRHNMSSRYNSDEQPNLDEVVTVRKPIIMEERESIDRPVVSEEKIVHDKQVEVATEKVTPLPTTQKIVQFRRGTRLTTQKAETVEPTESVATRKTGNRRRPIPSGFRTTRRPTTAEDTEATEKVQRVYPQNSQTERTYSQTHEHAKRVYRKRPVRIRHTTERQEEDEDAVDKIVRRSLDVDYETDVIPNEFTEEEEQNDPRTYENINEDIINGDIEEKEMTKNYNKETNTITNGNTEEHKNIENIDTKETDELRDENNQEREASESSQREIVGEPQKHVETVNEDNDRSMKDIKNTVENLQAEIIEEKLDIENEKATTKTDVKTIEENQAGVLDNQKEASENENLKKDVEIINPNYDPTKKHGGNYKKENENEEDAESEETIGNESINNEEAKVLDATYVKPEVKIVNNNFDKAKRHGGNYKANEDVAAELITTDKMAAESQQTESAKKVRSESSEKIVNFKEVEQDSKDNNNGKTRKTNPKSTTSGTKPVSRLTDVVPKPDHFYTDTQLPKEVNKLNVEGNGSKLDSEELEEVTEEGDITDDEDNTSKPSLSNRRSYNNLDKTTINKNLAEGDITISKNDGNTNIENDSVEDLVDSDDEFEEKVIHTTKPVFIKDPSKRLYFYAPV